MTWEDGEENAKHMLCLHQLGGGCGYQSIRLASAGSIDTARTELQTAEVCFCSVVSDMLGNAVSAKIIEVGSDVKLLFRAKLFIDILSFLLLMSNVVKSFGDTKMKNFYYQR